MLGLFSRYDVASRVIRNSRSVVSVKSRCCTTYDFLSKPASWAAVEERRVDRSGIITEETARELEKLSLVDFGGEKGVKIVEDAICFADRLEEVNTEGVEPLVTVLEDASLYLREDDAKSDVNVEELLSHSAKTLENYYVSPIDNVDYVPPPKPDRTD